MIGGLLALEGLFMLIPLATSIYYEENDWITFAFSAAITFFVGWGLYYRRPQSNYMGKREGFLLTASVWAVFSLFGLMPFMLRPGGLDFSSAFFEAISAFTTTGATSIPSDNPMLSHGLKMWNALMQWLGGMGIMLFTLAIIPALNSAGGMQMFNAEVTGITKEKLLPRVSQNSMALWGVYLLLTIAMVALLWIGPMDFFDSVCHAFGTLSTGGYSPRAGGINEITDDYVLIVILVFMFLGGINLANFIRIVLRKWRALRNDEIVRAYFWTIIVFTLLFAATSWLHGARNLRELTLFPMFQVVSTLTSTGYIAPGFNILGSFLLSLTFLMMFSGGCAGSTSGGAKIDRLVFTCKHLRNQIRQVTRPREVMSVNINHKVVSYELVSKVVAFLCLYVLCVVAGGVVLSAMGLPAVDSFFSAFSCISNSGYNASLTGYGADFLALPAAAKWVLSALMLIGRLEIFTVLVIFTPSFWER